eukprot:CAMPEP_0201282002 /NCGR_PEP_ID=MMETSP1317-20130820/4626_1 /ASSEMBLY_ACC=CAM_ASM_000770 /TAXON_ID=187299 /ORGANISM="Undescribed Undescribed, Strain Undescribed" /LENGTH=37 /DNA_ID= /DNA_START= /DNA_END= /DNA_ORIENTATION=
MQKLPSDMDYERLEIQRYELNNQLKVYITEVINKVKT